jgi:hypothetical protein
MRKWLIGVIIVVVALALVAGGAVTAAALSRNGTRASTFGLWHELRMGLGRQSELDLGPMHKTFFGALAEGLGITGEDLEGRLQSGESLSEIAEAEGLSEEELASLLSDANEAALQAAVDQGLLTQEQADWMAEHMPLARGTRGWLMMRNFQSPQQRGGMWLWIAPGRNMMRP